MHSGLQWVAKRLVRILVGHDGLQHRRDEDSSEGGGSRSPRTVLLRAARNIYIMHILIIL